MYQDDETTIETPGYTYYFRYIPYLFLAVLCYSMGYILLAFRKEDIQKRMLASAISTRRQNLEGLLAMFTISLVLWLIVVAGAGIMYGNELLTSKVLGYYLLNTFLMLTIALSLAYLIGLFMKNTNMLNGITNIVSLGMCFLSGVFVPINIMDKKSLRLHSFCLFTGMKASTRLFPGIMSSPVKLPLISGNPWESKSCLLLLCSH